MKLNHHNAYHLYINHALGLCCCDTAACDKPRHVIKPIVSQSPPSHCSKTAASIQTSIRLNWKPNCLALGVSQVWLGHCSSPGPQDQRCCFWPEAVQSNMGVAVFLVREVAGLSAWFAPLSLLVPPEQGVFLRSLKDLLGFKLPDVSFKVSLCIDLCTALLASSAEWAHHVRGLWWFCRRPNGASDPARVKDQSTIRKRC